VRFFIYLFTMIQSLFILSSTGQILIERHFRGVITSRQICDTFWSQAAISMNHHGGISNSNSTLWMTNNSNTSNMFGTNLNLFGSTSNSNNTTSGGGSSISLTAIQPLYDTVPPVMELSEIPVADAGTDQGSTPTTTSTLYVLSVLRDGISYLSVCSKEVSPLLVIELLHRIADTFRSYFGIPADESAIKDNFSTVYQLLEEMIDYGYPLTTEGNALQAMIRPPTVLTKLLSFHQPLLSSSANAAAKSTIINDELPSGTVSLMPWRTAGVVYTQNEIYIDIIEQVDATIDNSTGQIIQCDVSGSIQCQSYLSGIPELLLTFTDPTVIDDVSFHPCVRYSRYENDTVVSFVPPDGSFELMKYRINIDRINKNLSTPPIYCNAQWIFDTISNNDKGISNTTTSSSTTTTTTSTSENNHEQIGKLVLNVGVSNNLNNCLIFSNSNTNRTIVEDVCVSIPFPKRITQNTFDFRVNVGTVQYDESAKIARWNIGKIDSTATITTTGNSNNSTGSNQHHNIPFQPTFTCKFTLVRHDNDEQKRLLLLTSKTNSNTNSKVMTSSLVNSSTITSLTGYGTNTNSIRAQRGYRTKHFNNKSKNKNQSSDTNNNSNWIQPTLSLGWKIPLASVSGLSVSGLSVTGQSYRPYKGVRNITKSGIFQVRST
jgi:AP-3 complex subunit mu